MATPDINAVTRSQEFYRLKLALQSSGAIFELNESTRALYIGPDSDVGEVRVQYFDPDGPNSIQSATLSVNGPFVGRLDALLATQVASLGQPARLLISPVDQIDNTYVGRLPLTVPFRAFNLPTFIDVIAALKDLPDIPSVRADRTMRLARIPYLSSSSGGADDGSTNLIVPIYGRRMVTVSVVGTQGFQVGYGLVNLTPGLSLGPRFLGYSDAGAPGAVRVAVIRASDASRHIETTNLAGATTGYAFESDRVPATNENAALVAPRGMADLLMINVKYDISVPGATLRYVDIYITLADRET